MVINMKGIWVVWNNREANPENYKDLDEIYLILSFAGIFQPKDDNEVFEYCRKIEKANKVPYIVIVYADLSDSEYLKQLNKYSKQANILTWITMYIHRLLFPSCQPCIQAWQNNTTRKLEYFNTDTKILKDNFSIFRWRYYKKLRRKHA